jgi:hypothetical protein
MAKKSWKNLTAIQKQTIMEKRRRSAFIRQLRRYVSQNSRRPAPQTWYLGIEADVTSFGLQPNVDIFIPRAGQSPEEIREARQTFNRELARLQYAEESRMQGIPYKSHADRRAEQLHLDTQHEIAIIVGGAKGAKDAKDAK